MPSVTDRIGSEDHDPDESAQPRPEARVGAGDIAPTGRAGGPAGQARGQAGGQGANSGHAGDIYGTIMLGLPPEPPGDGG